MECKAVENCPSVAIVMVVRYFQGHLSSVNDRTFIRAYSTNGPSIHFFNKRNAAGVACHYLKLFICWLAEWQNTQNSIPLFRAEVKSKVV